MSSDLIEIRPMIAVVDAVCDVEESKLPFGKRWGQQRIRLTDEHLVSLRAGKLLALDVNEEYVVFLELKHEGA